MASPLPADETPLVVIIGGSQGAQAINAVVPEAVATLLDRGIAVRVIHQTGARTRDDVAREYAARAIDAVEVTAFIDDVADVMAQASLVVCRAGAMTVAELGVIGRPCVYIPLPTAADDHQRKNAEAMTARGAARWIPQGELSAARVADACAEILGDPELRERMGAAAWRSARPDAAGVIADALMVLAGSA
jgi:UDP-N-acetylglucosamine--N-acetylmuramyl-(pentapeptide) pyrophosphoryl-undecaprenol N-acetylglucosamine transferase